MFKGHIAEKLLLKVVDDLKDFLPYLVLVGGWVPYVYAKYIWQDVPNVAVTTSDIDFGVGFKEYKGNESIASRVRKLDYGEHHISMDRTVPFVPVVKLSDSSEKADVEFISTLEVPEYIKGNLIGQEIKLNQIEYFDILFESIITVSISKCNLQVPKETIFIFHKLLTFVQRENKEKLAKDLYYVYYMLRFCPQKNRLIKDIKLLIKSREEGRTVISNLDMYFKDIYSKGSILIEQENGPDDFISNVREDAYSRIKQLLI